MYDPQNPPVVTTHEGTEILRYMYTELRNVAAVLQGIGQGQYLPILYAAPERPREPQVAFADGTNWDPGSGKGLYVYYDSAWHFAG